MALSWKAVEHFGSEVQLVTVVTCWVQGISASSFLSLDTSWSHLRRGNWGLSPSNRPENISMGHFLDWPLIWESPATMGGAISGQMVLGCLRKVPKQALGSKPDISFPLWSLHFPHWFPLVMGCDWDVQIRQTLSFPCCFWSCLSWQQKPSWKRGSSGFVTLLGLLLPLYLLSAHNMTSGLTYPRQELIAPTLETALWAPILFNIDI